MLPEDLGLSLYSSMVVHHYLLQVRHSLTVFLGAKHTHGTQHAKHPYTGILTSVYFSDLQSVQYCAAAV